MDHNPSVESMKTRSEAQRDWARWLSTHIHLGNIVAMESTIGDLLARSTRRFGDRPAVIAPDRTLSFNELSDLSRRMTRGLHVLGVRAGDRVTLWMENGWRWLVAYYGVLQVGAVINPVNILLTPDEVAFIVNNCGAKLIIAGAEKIATLREFVDIQLIEEKPSFQGTAISFDSLLDNASDDSAIPPSTLIGADHASTICYTSGTTGRPKGAILRHSSIVINTLMTALMQGKSKDDVIVSALPCTHVYGNIVLNTAIACGATLVLLPRFEEKQVLKAIEQHHATIFEGVPTMFMKLLNDAAFDGTDFSALRMCTVGGQTMPLAKMEEAERRLGCRLIELWGMTELGGLGTTHPHRGPRKLGSIGVALPLTQAKVVSSEDPKRELPCDTVGELVIRGPLVMEGYYGDADATHAAIDDEGWLRTGDLVRQDKDGFFFVIDRSKEVIINGGYNVYPAEVERVIAEIPAIAMVSVAAMNDALKGQVPKAFVVLRRGTTCTAASVIEHCRAQLASYKVPREVIFLDDLPKTSTGKILRRVLAEQQIARSSVV